MRPTDAAPPAANDRAPVAPKATSARAHRWRRVEGDPAAATCEVCGATLRAWLDTNRPAVAARVTRTGPEKCPGRPLGAPPVTRRPPPVCAAAAAWWWKWDEWKQLPMFDLGASCGVLPRGHRGDIAPGGASVSVGWTEMVRADDGPLPPRLRRRAPSPPVCVGRSCAPSCQGVTPC